MQDPRASTNVRDAVDAEAALATALAAHLRSERDALVARWLERIMSRVALTPNRVFPSEDLLNHVPLLIDGIADYVEHPDEPIDTEIPVAAKAMELGALRHAQGFDAYQILKEYELLAAIIFSSIADVVDGMDGSSTPRGVTRCCQRVAHAIELIRQATMTHFLRLSAERVDEREERLRRFNRMVSHELKNRVGAITGAVKLLDEEWLESSMRGRFQQMIAENASGLQRVLGNLEALSRIEANARQRKNVLLPQVCTESVRQLRDLAQARGVDVRLADNLPPVEVDAAGVELCLVNYLSNAIKYSDPNRDDRWVEVEAAFERADSGGLEELVIRVRDNGVGVPVDERSHLFEQFYRTQTTVTGIEGTGLGLSIVRDTAQSMGGRAWAEFPETGAIFAFSLPSRREEDAAAAGTHRPDGSPL
jgi:signal transduction histidine kinase